MIRNGRNPKSPAFQVYPGDFIHNVETAGMSAEEIGAYWLLLCFAWDAPLPNDPKKLARMARLTAKKFAKAWSSIRRCFTLSDANTLTNPRQERERKFQKENRDRLLELSKKGVQARQDAERREQSGAPCGDAPLPDAQCPTPEAQIPTPGVENNPAHEPPESRTKKPRKPASGPNAESIRHWEAEWARTRLGTKCAITTADGVAVAWMLEQADAQEVRRRMTAMLEDGEAWIAKNASPSLLRSKWNAYAVTLTRHAASNGSNVADLWRSQKDRA